MEYFFSQTKGTTLSNRSFNTSGGRMNTLFVSWIFLLIPM